MLQKVLPLVIKKYNGTWTQCVFYCVYENINLLSHSTATAYTTVFTRPFNMATLSSRAASVAYLCEVDQSSL